MAVADKVAESVDQCLAQGEARIVGRCVAIVAVRIDQQLTVRAGKCERVAR